MDRNKRDLQKSEQEETKVDWLCVELFLSTETSCWNRTSCTFEEDVDFRLVQIVNEFRSHLTVLF